MNFKKLLAVSIAALILSACGGGGNDSPLGGGGGSHLGGGDYNDDYDDSGDNGDDYDDSEDVERKKMVHAITDCVTGSSTDIADSTCYNGTFYGHFGRANFTSGKCKISYKYDGGATGTHKVYFEGELDRSFQTNNLSLIQRDDGKSTSATFDVDGNTPRVWYDISQVSNSLLVVNADDKDRTCYPQKFVPAE